MHGDGQAHGLEHQQGLTDYLAGQDRLDQPSVLFCQNERLLESVPGWPGPAGHRQTGFRHDLEEHRPRARFLRLGMVALGPGQAAYRALCRRFVGRLALQRWCATAAA